MRDIKVAVMGVGGDLGASIAARIAAMDDRPDVIVIDDDCESLSKVKETNQIKKEIGIKEENPK